jgi:hypothetical protein
MKNEIKSRNKARSDHGASVFGKIIGVVLLVISVISDPLLAETNPLTERGIDPKILDVMVTDLSQNVRYTLQTDIQVSSESQNTRDRALVFFEPGTEYGIDLYMKFEEGDVNTMAPRKFRKMLENRMRLQHRLRTMDITYDPKSVEVESQDGDKAVIRFRYQEYALPQPVAWMRFLQGRIWVEGDQVKRIDLKLDEGRRFMADGIKYSQMQSTSEFVRVADGRDLVLSTKSEIIAKYYGVKLFKWGEEFTVNMDSTALSYVDDEGTILFGTSPEAAELAADLKNPKTVRVKLDRTLPIWGGEVRRMGFDLPRPWGLSAMYTQADNNVRFTSFELNGNQEGIEAIFDPEGSGIDVTAKVPLVRADVFVLPFLDLMVMGGNATAEGDLMINTTELGQIIGLDPIVEGHISLDMTMLGAGVALAGGYKNAFAALTYTYMTTKTKGASTESVAKATTGLVGYQFPNYRMRVMFGAEYLALQEVMEGTLDLGGGETLAFNIGVESEAWAWRAGIMKEFGNHMEGLVSYSWGEDRNVWTFMLGYRW